MLKIKTNKPAFSILFLFGLLSAGAFLYGDHAQLHQKTDIKVADAATSFDQGRILSGKNTAESGKLASTAELKFESQELETDSRSTNAIGFEWTQEGDEASGGGAELEVRTLNGKTWSEWVPLSADLDKPDSEEESAHSGVVLAKDASKVQYRFALKPGSDGKSPEITAPKLTFIDATKGPDPTKKSVASRLFGESAKAGATGPGIYTRADWGCPEATSSPRWDPEYRVLTRAIVHHTAATTGPDSAAAIRSVWYYHANTQDWGDIGYNYLVDQRGNIFQGRYYDHAYARSINQDVVGGHTYGANYGSTGISTLGNFNNDVPTAALLNSVGNMAGWKAMPYGTYNPGNNTVGHRDAGQSSCPGNNLYNALGTVRAHAANYFDYYSRWQQYDYSYQGQGVNGSPANSVSLRAFQTATFYLDLKNEGSTAWSTSNVRLGTDRPMNRASGFAHSSWINSSRPGTFAGRVSGGSLVADSSIEPGEVGRFQFTIQAPNANGAIQEYFQPVAEGYTWFVRNLGINWTINVTPDIYSYQWLGQQYGLSNTPNTNGTGTATLKNTGNVDWSNSGANAVKLAPNRPNDRYSWMYNNAWLSPTRVASFAGKAQLDGSGNPVRDGSGNVVYDSGATTIAPGEAAHFVFTMKTPDRPVVLNEHFNLVAEGRAWMNDVGMAWPLNFPASNFHAQWTGQSAAPTIDKSVNGVGSIYFDWKNTGSYPWKKSDLVRLAPNNPNDRSSIFAALGLTGGQLPTNTANWLSNSRVGTFAGKVSGGSLDTAATVINPGETGRFFAALDARNVPARIQPYREHFRLVAEYFTWMEDYGAFLDIVVQD